MLKPGTSGTRGMAYLSQNSLGKPFVMGPPVARTTDHLPDYKSAIVLWPNFVSRAIQPFHPGRCYPGTEKSPTYAGLFDRGAEIRTRDL